VNTVCFQMNSVFHSTVCYQLHSVFYNTVQKACDEKHYIYGGLMIAIRQGIVNNFGLEYGSPVIGHAMDIFTSVINLLRKHINIVADFL